MLKKTKDFRLAEWKKILVEVNACGMSKRAWCKANGITERKLYYWQHRIWQTESTGHHLSEKQELSVVGLPLPPYAVYNIGGGFAIFIPKF